MKQYAAKRDANEPAIIAALEAAGCIVLKLNSAGAPDLLVQSPDGLLYLLEVKAAHGTLTPAQRHWQAQGLRVAIVRTPEQALAAVGRSVAGL